MARINLLPWRAERRKLRQKEFMTMLGIAALAGVVLWFLVNSYYNAQIDGQNERNAYLDQQIAEVKKKNAEIDKLDQQKSRLLARKEVIEGLQADRSKMVHLFDSLVRTIPDGVVLTTIKQEGETLTLEGRSQSNARVSTYMRNLEGSGWMTQPDLNIIQAEGENKGLPYVYKLTVTLANPNAPKDENKDGVPDAPAAPVVAPTGTSAPAATTAPAPASSAPATSPAASPAPGAQQPATTPASPPAPATQPAAPAKGGAAS